MYKIILYAQDGFWMREWKANWYEWAWDYRGVKFAIPVGENDQKEIVVLGGIVIIEDLESESEKETHS